MPIFSCCRTGCSSIASSRKSKASTSISEWAIQQVSDDLFQAYDRLNDDYLRERRGDLEDIVRRLAAQPAVESRSRRSRDCRTTPSSLERPFRPRRLFELRSQRIVGLATETGSPLSHTAIMARSLEIPAVMGAPICRMFHPAIS